MIFFLNSAFISKKYITSKMIPFFFLEYYHGILSNVFFQMILFIKIIEKFFNLVDLSLYFILYEGAIWIIIAFEIILRFKKINNKSLILVGHVFLKDLCWRSTYKLVSGVLLIQVNTLGTTDIIESFIILSCF